MVELRLSGVGKTYAGEVPLRALRDVTLTIRQGEFISIQGPSGAGKSTLLNQLALLDTPTSGDYLIDGVGVRTLGERRRAVVRSENFAFIFQSFHLLPGRSVVENVALGLLYRGLGHRRRLLAARRALDFVGLGRKSSQRVEKLSGGERQRVAIARALARGPRVILADEPTGNLDSATGEMVLRTFRAMQDRGKTIVLITHDPEIATWADRVVHIRDGRLLTAEQEREYVLHHSAQRMAGGASL